MDEERTSSRLGLVLCGSFSALTLLVGWQEGHLARENPRSSNRQRFSSRLGKGERPNGEPGDPDSPGKMAIKWK